MTGPHSLRLRLTLVSALTIVATLTAAGAVLSLLFAKHVERVAAQELGDELNRLTSIVAENPLGLVFTDAKMGDPSFEMPYGGSYWQIRDPHTGQTVRSRSMWDKTFEFGRDALVATHPTELWVADPEGGSAVALGRLLTFQTWNGRRRDLQLVVAESTAQTDAAIAGYRGDLFVALLVFALILIAAAWLQVTVGLSPLRALTDGLSAVRAGTQRELRGRFPREVVPLVAEFNHVNRAQDLAIEFARSRAADLAHGLKTALQVLTNSAHRLRLRGQEEAADDIDEIVRQMTTMIDHQLRLARLRQRLPPSSRQSDLWDIADRIVQALSRADRGSALRWNNEVAPGTTVALDQADLFELLGALLENAAKWATGQVRIAGLVGDGICQFSIEDDGPGLTAGQISRLGRRGARLDEAKSGTGIGLSIAREIVAINGGDLSYGRSDLGGLRVVVRIPASTDR